MQIYRYPANTRVKRGADWKWGNQDDSGMRETPYFDNSRTRLQDPCSLIAGLGTIIKTVDSDGWVQVQWDNGRKYMYRMGADDGKFDLEVVTAQPAAASVRSTCWTASKSYTSLLDLSPLIQVASRPTRQYDAQLKQYLEKIQLDEYLDTLCDAGFDSIQRLKNATVDDLLKAGLKPGHARHLNAVLNSPGIYNFI
jgi:hypothetical protein